MVMGLFRKSEPEVSRPPVNLHDARLKHRGQAFPSPCVSVCRMSPQTQLCEGCFRTIDEIARWGAMDNAAREAIWSRIEQRQGRGAW